MRQSFNKLHCKFLIELNWSLIFWSRQITDYYLCISHQATVPSPCGFSKPFRKRIACYLQLRDLENNEFGFQVNRKNNYFFYKNTFNLHTCWFWYAVTVVNIVCGNWKLFLSTAPLVRKLLALYSSLQMLLYIKRICFYSKSKFRPTWLTRDVDDRLVLVHRVETQLRWKIIMRKAN